MIYLLIFVTIIALTYRYDYCNRKTGRLFCVIGMFLILVSLSGLRYRLGTDSIRYETYYKTIPFLWELSSNYFQKMRFEPGFVILMSLCRGISSDFTFFQFIHAIIINSAVFIFLYNNTRHFFLGLFLYCLILYIPLNFEVLRESLAIAMFLFAWPYFKSNSYLKYYLLILLAISFHIGSAICLLCPLTILPGINTAFSLGKRTFFICIGVIAVGFIINLMFFDIVRTLTFSATLVDRATAYSKDELGGNTRNIMGIIGSIIRWVIYPCIALYFIKRQCSHNKESGSEIKHLNAMVLMSVYIGLATIPISIWYRFNNYFLFFSILAISRFMFTSLQFEHKKYKFNFLYWCLFLLPLIVLQIRGQMNPVNYSGSLKAYMTYYPYSSRLNPIEDRNREAVFRYYRSW